MIFFYLKKILTCQKRTFFNIQHEFNCFLFLNPEDTIIKIQTISDKIRLQKLQKISQTRVVLNLYK